MARDSPMVNVMQYNIDSIIRSKPSWIFYLLLIQALIVIMAIKGLQFVLKKESSILRAQLLLPNYIKDITLNREGEVLSTPLYTADERQFRRSLRELLE